MITIYSQLLSLQSLKYLFFSLEFFGAHEVDCYLKSNLNQESTKLEYMTIDHPISSEEISSIVRYTPELLHLRISSLEGGIVIPKDGSSTISKLPLLTTLIIKESCIDFEQLRILLNALDCRLNTLEIHTLSFESFQIDAKWKQLLNTTLLGLKNFKIVFSGEIRDDDESDTDDNSDTDNIRFNNDFICDSFWYDHGWIAECCLDVYSVSSRFRRSK